MLFYFIYFFIFVNVTLFERKQLNLNYLIIFPEGWRCNSFQLAIVDLIAAKEPCKISIIFEVVPST